MKAETLVAYGYPLHRQFSRSDSLSIHQDQDQDPNQASEAGRRDAFDVSEAEPLQGALEWEALR